MSPLFLDQSLSWPDCPLRDVIRSLELGNCDYWGGCGRIELQLVKCVVSCGMDVWEIILLVLLHADSQSG